MNLQSCPINFFDYNYLTLKTADRKYVLPNQGSSVQVQDLLFEMRKNSDVTELFLTAGESEVEWVRLRWDRVFPNHALILGDVWERSYGDMCWQKTCGSRFMPWYFLASADGLQWGFGVKVRPSAMCYWQADTRGITLFLDVRCGGFPVRLKGRTLKMAELVSDKAKTEDSFRFARDFCKKMCTDPILSEEPIYGSNNWYYAYGRSSEAEILADADYLTDLTKGASHPPFMVIDDGWQENHRLSEYNGGPWTKGNHQFPDMEKLAEKIREKGVRPGIWLRLLQNEDPRIPDAWRLPRNGCLDPSHPAALEYIRQDIRRIAGWGYELIKHDFSTYDLFGRWGMEMNPQLTDAGWHFYDRSLTSAEIVKQLYTAIYEAAGEYGCKILGCNTIGHLGAGLMHAARTGDDTSGITWERTRKMGLNALAFRLPQHRTFFDIDADCVGIAGPIPWELNRQWADVLAESGTLLFVSVKPGILNPQEKEELAQIMRKASAQDCHKIPADWQDTDCPEIWEDENSRIEYNWYEPEGADLVGNDGLYHLCIPPS